MPPRTGPRRRKRVKPSPPLPARSFELLYGNDFIEMTGAHAVALDEGNLVFSDHDGAITRIITRGHWREVREVTAADLLPKVLREPELEPRNREQATPPPEYLTPPAEPVIPPEAEPDSRFVPASPEEAQRILMEIHRRIAPDYQDNPVYPPSEAGLTNGTDPPVPNLPNLPGAKE